MSDQLTQVIDVGKITLSAIRHAMDMVQTESAVKLLGVEYRKELFRLHQELGKILGVLDQEQEDAP